MCWPGPHQQNCEERVKHSRKGASNYSSSSDKLQCAIYYAIDGDQVSNSFQISNYIRLFLFQIYTFCYIIVLL